MSKFFAKGSSDSESEEEETSSEEESSEDEKPVKKAGASRPEETVRRGPRKVVSAKDKRFDEMRQTVKQLKNAIKINDWNAISNEFQKINQQISKANQLIQQEGIPRFYIKICVQLAELIENTSKDKDKVKKMSKTNAKSLNAMKQNIKKNNIQYEDDIKKYMEAPDQDSSSEKEEASGSGSDSSEASGSESSDSEASEKAKPAKKPSKPAKDDDDEGDDDDDDDDEQWPSDSSSSSEEEEDTSNQPRGISKWLKKPGAGSDSDDDGFEKVKKGKEPKKKPAPKKDSEEKVKEEKQQIVLTEENVKKKMDEIQNMRGKKGTSKKDQIMQLELLATAKISPSMTAQVLVQLISAQFDSSMQRGGVTHMPISFTTDDGIPSRENCMWTKCMGNIRRLLSVLKENPELTEEATGQSAVGEARQIDTEFDDMEEQIQVTSNLVSFVERLDDELYLSLRLLDNHSPDFLKRLLDIAPFLELAELVQDHYQAAGQSQVAARIAIRRLEHLYYKHNSLVAKAATITPQKGDRSHDREKFINDIAMQVYRYGDDSIKTRAMLSHIYYHALHDRFYQARDMLLMSHLQDSIHQTNSIPTQILFNRTMAQVGLSAFRSGLIAEAHGCFDELCGNNRLKELLAQGLSSQRFNDRSPEQERAEKRRQTPYHMHINLELVECCHLVGAVLIEIPKMVANSFDSKRKITSRALKRVFENSDRNPLSGPPETTRDVIMAGARALEKGDWRQCEAHILSLPVWSHLGSEECVAKVKSMLESKIREEALRTFLFAYSAYYDALSLEQLCEMFKLPKTLVNSLVSKMMIQDELFASWDQPTGSIVMHKKERSRLHHLAQQFSDLLGKFVDNNEKSWENKFGENRYGYNKEQNKQGGGWGQQGGSAGGGGQRFGHRSGGTGGPDRQDTNRAGNAQLRAGDRGPRDRGSNESWRPV